MSEHCEPQPMSEEERQNFLTQRCLIRCVATAVVVLILTIGASQASQPFFEYLSVKVVNSSAATQ